MSETLKWTGRGFIGIDVWDTYKEGEDWQKEAGKEGLKIVSSIAIPALIEAGLFVTLSFTPIGWVAIIAVGVTDAVAIMATDHYIDTALQ